jgi:hypothetical protein
MAQNEFKFNLTHYISEHAYGRVPVVVGSDGVIRMDAESIINYIDHPGRYVRLTSLQEWVSENLRPVDLPGDDGALCEAAAEPVSCRQHHIPGEFVTAQITTISASGVGVIEVYTDVATRRRAFGSIEERNQLLRCYFGTDDIENLKEQITFDNI